MIWNLDNILWFLVLAGSFVMVVALLKGVMTAANVAAIDLIDQRRTMEAIRARANAEAEAAGRAASLEPLNLNSDGSIEEPILGIVEKS